MKLSYQAFSTALAAMKQMEKFQPNDPRWPNAIYELREAFLSQARGDISGRTLLDTSHRPALLRPQA